MATIDVVRWDAAPGVFAWKFPSNSLSTRTQLIVSESQEAILLKEGQMFGPFGAGRHVLTTKNYPFLTPLLKGITGQTPFTAEVWFIQKSFKLNIKWGTVTAMQLEDPKYKIMLPVRAFGQYGIVVENSSLFLFKLVGTLPAFVERTIKDYFKGIIITQIKDLIAKYLVEKNISILQISAHLNKISAATEVAISEKLEEYGLKVVNFSVNSISTSEDDSAVIKLKNALAAKAEMDILGYNYQQKRSFDTLETAAGNQSEGSSIMNAGIGLGMGFGIGGPVGNMANNLGQNLQVNNVKNCLNCHKEISSDVKFCSFCGANNEQSLKAPMIECTKCKTILQKGTKFCPNCGVKLVKNCPNCTIEVEENLKFCNNCGKKLILEDNDV